MVKQTEDELKSHLKEQIQFLIRSCESYDKGFESEAKRLAVVIRVLLHDTSRSKSLLNLLKMKNILFYDSTVDLPPNVLFAQTGLVRMQIGSSSNELKYIPPLDNDPPERVNKKVPFTNWWNKTVFFDINRNKFSRNDLILAIANKDGGAHVDPDLNEAYANLSKFGSLGQFFLIKNGVKEYFNEGPELPSIRQITHEVLKSLKDEFPEYF